MMVSKQHGSCIPHVGMLPRKNGCAQDALDASAAHRAPVAGHPRLQGYAPRQDLVLGLLQEGRSQAVSLLAGAVLPVTGKGLCESSLQQGAWRCAWPCL